jgi:C-terminal processing protease CtpA/Prc
VSAVRRLGALLLWTTLLSMGSALGCGGAGGASAGASGSIGAVFGRDSDSGALYVRDVARGLAAEDAGLLPGDQVVMIDGRYVRDLDEKEIRQALRGEAATTVSLTLLRGEEVRHARITRSARRSREPAGPREQKITE